MPVYRCNHCGLVAEEPSRSAGDKIHCSRCKTMTTLFDTVFYVEKLVERYLVIRREVEALKQDNNETEHSHESAAASANQPLLKDNLQSTALLATELQHKPLHDWFLHKQIKANFAFAQVDTTGFFDEAAAIIGNQYETLTGLLEQVRFAYRQEWSWINVDLNRKTPQDAKIIGTAVRELYSHTFFARHTHQKQKNTIGLSLQPAQTIRQFFDGGWLEWWVFIRMLELCVERNKEFSCARGVKIEFQNEDLRELDVVFLLKNSFPVIVECKSGEFRGEIEKYVKLKRRLSLDRSQFVICNPDLTNEQAAGLTTMYDLTFLNLQSFIKHIEILTS
jgi:phage FluMu protein Com